jgi:UDP-glucose 4-epimerase
MFNLIIGGSGFVGRRLSKTLLDLGEEVLVLDIDVWKSAPRLKQDKSGVMETIYPTDLKWSKDCISRLKFKKNIRIWHLAANSDIAKASKDFEIDYELTLGSTLEALKVAAEVDCKSIEFTSSSAVYGNRVGGAKFFEADLLLPISNYGNMKLSSEVLIRIFADKTSVPYHIHRLANIVGPDMTHGLIFDLVNKIKRNSNELQVLGDGKQRKTYMHVDDLIHSMIEVSKMPESLVINTGPADDGVTVSEVVSIVLRELEIDPIVHYGTKPEGWHGDVVDSVMDTSRMRTLLNFQPRDSRESVEAAVKSRVLEIL